MTPVLFAGLVFAWGFTWYAIKLQIGPVPMEASICYRFIVAALVMWGWLAATGRLKRARPAQHLWFALMGVSLFGLNFVLVYEATQYIASGVVSVLFSAATVFNAFNQWAFMGKRPTARVLAGAALGIAGIALLFEADFAEMEMAATVPLGIALALGGTFVFSLGNLVSLRAARGGLDLPNVVARGMSWGAAFLALLVLVRGRGFGIELTPEYLLSLLYLAIPGSVLAFLAYLTLVGRVGADRAAYATVLFPVVALTVSTMLEGYVWTPAAIAGLPLILLGNLVIFAPPLRRRAARTA